MTCPFVVRDFLCSSLARRAMARFSTSAFFAFFSVIKQFQLFRARGQQCNTSSSKDMLRGLAPLYCHKSCKWV